MNSAKLRGKWAKRIPIISALIVASAPGFYSAWQGAKQAWRQRAEVQVRDAQEGDLQGAVKANTEAIKAIRDGMVTHKDLVDLVLKLQAANRPRSENRPAAGSSAPLSSAIAALRGKVRVEATARQKAAQALKRAPSLKSAAKVRSMIQQKAAF